MHQLRPAVFRPYAYRDQSRRCVKNVTAANNLSHPDDVVRFVVSPTGVCTEAYSGIGLPILLMMMRMMMMSGVMQK
ncbi:heterogeneous nuclear ribonucleoprotein L [Anopheles sinensis]|uniref:Heterogeneous nuclear ribonucleoprotein L n=1 Tax=Anopheles sinensis TaxID=74873 RepID=A0A084WCX9_ANOSI|nr:heterogeneous nuclear ribonucleoprotein L [Anopheles sinensis]